jgi:hypothetical protein
MSEWLMRVMRAEASRLIELAADDDELRADLRALAESILAATAPPSRLVESIDHSIAIPGDDQTDAPEADEPLRELTLGQSPPPKSDPRAVPPAASQRKAPADDLARLETRSRQKAEAAHRAAERLRRAREGNDCAIEDAPIDPELVAWGGGLVDSFFWLQATNIASSVDFALVDNVGGCFEAVAEALALVRAMLDEHPGKPQGLERSLPLVAEAQSGLRAAFQRLGTAADPEQLEIFEWLKVTAARNHVYIKRFMRADEVADPDGWDELLARIELVSGAGQQSRISESQVARIQNCLKPLQDSAGDNDDDNWMAMINVVDEIVGEGVPPSNREIRELLLPVIDELPERNDYPDGFRLALREIDRFLSTRSAPARTSIAHKPSAELQIAARLLSGKSIVLIGGNRRREAQESLRRALGLKDLVWIETKEHQAIDAFEPLIARTDVALVLLAIRWSSHGFGDVRQICERHYKLLVRLPGGYNPNQVAAQILAQSSSQLSSDAGPGETSAHP